MVNLAQKSSRRLVVVLLSLLFACISIPLEAQKLETPKLSDSKPTATAYPTATSRPRNTATPTPAPTLTPTPTSTFTPTFTPVQSPGLSDYASVAPPSSFDQQGEEIQLPRGAGTPQPPSLATPLPGPYKMPGIRILSQLTRAGNLVQSIYVEDPETQATSEGDSEEVPPQENNATGGESSTEEPTPTPTSTPTPPGPGCNMAVVEVLAKEITYGSGGPSVPVRVDYHFGIDTYLPLYSDANTSVGMSDLVSLGDGGVMALRGKSAYPNFQSPTFHMEIASDDPTNALILHDNDNYFQLAAAKGVQAAYGNQLEVTQILQDYINPTTGVVNLDSNELIILYELGTRNQSSYAFDFQDLVLKVSICGDVETGDYVIDHLPRLTPTSAPSGTPSPTPAPGSITFGISRISADYGTSGKRAIAYTEIDNSSLPGAPTERLYVCLATNESGPGGVELSPNWVTCRKRLVYTRDMSDPTKRPIRSLDLAIGAGSFHAIGWVEVYSTSTNTNQAETGTGEETRFRYMAIFSVDDGNTWAGLEQVGQYHLSQVGLNYAGNIDLAINDFDRIGVLLGYDQDNPAMDEAQLLGMQGINDALVMLEYQREPISGNPGVFGVSDPMVWSFVSGDTNPDPDVNPDTDDIDIVGTPGVKNMLDLTAGLGGQYVLNQGWQVPPPGDPANNVFHAYYSQGGRSTIFSLGIGSGSHCPMGEPQGSPECRVMTSRQTIETTTGVPSAAVSRKNATIVTKDGVYEVPPKGSNAGLWQRAVNGTFNTLTGNRSTDNIFSTETWPSTELPGTVEAFMMNTAGTVVGPTVISTDVVVVGGQGTVPHCGNVSTGLCYEWGSDQFGQEDRGALVSTGVGNVFYSTSIRRFYMEAEAGPGQDVDRVEVASEVVLHTAENMPLFDEAVGFDRVGVVSNSTNNTGGVFTQWGTPVNPLLWGTTGSVWTAPESGKLGVLRSIVWGWFGNENQCIPPDSPPMGGLTWAVRIWNSLNGHIQNPQGGDYVINFNDPTNSSYQRQYGIYTPVGCGQAQPTYDLRFDLSQSNIQVQEGQEYVVAVVAYGGTMGNGEWYQAVSAIPPAVDYFGGAATNGEVLPLSQIAPLSIYPRYGRSLTIISSQ